MLASALSAGGAVVAGFEDCYDIEVTVPPYDPEASLCPPVLR
jgi:hypothetical protein